MRYFPWAGKDKVRRGPLGSGAFSQREDGGEGIWLPMAMVMVCF
jgi:hypothetical protein